MVKRFWIQESSERHTCPQTDKRYQVHYLGPCFVVNKNDSLFEKKKKIIHLFLLIFLDESQHQQRDFPFENCFILHTECFTVLPVSMFLRQVLIFIVTLCSGHASFGLKSNLFIMFSVLIKNGHFME